MRDLILADVLLARTLDEPALARLVEIAEALARGKRWEGCRGLRMSDEVMAVIAGQAAFLLLGLGDYRFDEVGTILVYPGRFLPDRDDELGLEEDDEEDDWHLGQSVQDGPVILSWWDARWQARRRMGGNVVLHEFAHKLAELGDPASGMPPIADPGLAQRWKKVMGEEYRRLRRQVGADRPTLLDPYGAESPSEFFAVATETFFLRPVALKDRHPDLYALLADCYRQDPAARPVIEEEDAEAAEREYDRMVERECTQALERDPDNAEMREERAEARTCLGDFAGAMADWEALGGETTEALLGRAWTLRRADRPAEALAACEQAQALAEDDPEPRFQKAAALEALGRDAEALAALEEVFAMDESAETLAMRARLHRKAGRAERALADLERAARLDPYQGQVFEARAEILEGLGRIAEAEADRERARRLLS